MIRLTPESSHRIEIFQELDEAIIGRKAFGLKGIEDEDRDEEIIEEEDHVEEGHVEEVIGGRRQEGRKPGKRWKTYLSQLWCMHLDVVCACLTVDGSFGPKPKPIIRRGKRRRRRK